MSEVIKIGQVSILEDGAEQGKQYTAVRKITYAKELKTIGISCEERFIPELDKILYFVLYSLQNESELAYGKFENSLVFLNSAQSGSYFVYRQEMEDPEDEIEAMNAVEFHFSGHAQLQIELSADEIKSEFGQENITKYFVMGGLVLLLAGAVIYLFFGGEAEPINVAPPPPPPPLELTTPQKAWINSLLSKDIILQLKDKTIELKNDPFANIHKRISNFNLKESAAQTGGAGEYPEVSMEGEITYEYDFPAKGTTKLGLRQFVQVEKITATKKITGAENFNDKESSSACVKEVLSMVGDLSVEERTGESTKVSFAKMAPTAFIEPFIRLSTVCPVYIESISVADGAFSGTLMLYGGEK
jgi:hypothetical protein